MRRNIHLLFCLFITLIVSGKTTAQTMTANDILYNLKVYQDLLDEIYKHELVYLQKREDFISLKKELSLKFNSIKLELDIEVKKAELPGGTWAPQYCTIHFEMKGDKFNLENFYCEDKTREHEIKKIIHKNKEVNNFQWKTNPDSNFYQSKEISNYLNIADRIAMQVYNCSRGDDYSPGYFSEMSIKDDWIQLRQQNYMHAKSLDHKDNYTMRKLEIDIPLYSYLKRDYYCDHQIGSMYIDFSDHSKGGREECGNRIKEQIETEKADYKK